MREFLPDPSSPYQLLLEASRSEDPLSSLEILKDSIRNSQEQDGGEVTIGQVQGHMKMEGFVDAAKRSAEGDLYSFQSEGLYSVGIFLTYLQTGSPRNSLGSPRTKKLSTTKMKLCHCSVWFLHN